MDTKPANPLDKKIPQTQVEIDAEYAKLYTDTDKEYFSFLQSRLQDGKSQKDSVEEYLNGKTQYQIYEENEKIANTNLPAKKNEDDVIVSAGTIEAKLDALLANVNNLDLSANVLAYDTENNMISELGLALQDTIFMTEEHDGGEDGGDEEKKMMRQRELLKQGTVFVQEEWLRLFETKKKLTKDFDGSFKFKDWTSTKELVYEGPGRTMLHGPNVYLGNQYEFSMENQPFIFTMTVQDQSVVKAKYGHFDNFKFVKAGATTESDSTKRTIFDNTWRCSSELKANQMEVIIYQDKFRDEFQIIINGVLMLPCGFPLSAVSPSGGYNITKQVYRIINAKYAYGKSFVSSGSVKEVSALIDEMLKLFVLKTRKSFSPPYVNTSGKVISKKVLSPGRISMGIPPDALQAIGQEGQGVTANEFSVLKELQDRIDKSTVSNVFQGQQSKGGTTATEIVELQKQAKLTLGLTIAVCALLEKKLAYLRLYNILENWYNPIDTKVVTIDSVRKEIKKYRNTTREVNIDGEGMGERMVIPTDQGLPTAKDIRKVEIAQEKRTGFPARKIFLDPEALKVARLRWYITITPKEKESSALYKLLFREMFGDILGLMQLGSRPNIDTLEDEFSRVWGKSRSKLFQKGGTSPALAAPGAPAPGGGAPMGLPNAAGIPKVPVA